MIKENHILLSTTHHDPESRLFDLMKRVLPTICKLFTKTIVCCTPSTGKKVISLLKSEGFGVFIGTSMNKLDNYKSAIKVALDNFENNEIQRIMYIDFDRLIHWAINYPDELIQIVSNPIGVDYLHIGRSLRAFNTHPPTQLDTERIINEIGSKILGFTDIRDIISVCFVMNDQLSKKILTYTNSTATGFYSSWPIIFWNSAKNKKYIEVEGLEWETPDQYRKEIKEMGFERWLKEFQSPQEWKRRVSLLHDGLSELSLLTKFMYQNLSKPT
jgi:hypothetical protein